MRFLSLLALLFIALKLIGYINWSWWMVLAPIWGPVAAIVVLGFLIVVLALVVRGDD